MELGRSKPRDAIAAPALAAPLVAALACLQPGVDPVFLSILTSASGTAPLAHGWIVGGTQAGAAIGSLAVWRMGPALRHRAIVIAALIALACSLATTATTLLTGLLALRFGYGMAMGVVYARAMATYAASHPNKAYGAVFLTQLLLSTLVSLTVPELALIAGARVALACFALVPGLALAASVVMGRDAGKGHAASAAAEERHPVPVAGWALAAATFWFICSTMLVWSFTAALATGAGIPDRTIGRAVAIGSVSGALTAIAVMRERLVVPLPVTAVLAGLSLAAPIAMIAPGGDARFVVSVVLLNIGSTAIIIRTSGLATATSADARFRIFVACTHSLGLIAGPLLGSAMVWAMGPQGLGWGVGFALLGGIGSVLLAMRGREQNKALD